MAQQQDDDFSSTQPKLEYICVGRVEVSLHAEVSFSICVFISVDFTALKLEDFDCTLPTGEDGEEGDLTGQDQDCNIY